ncbi:MAG: tRNA (guanosine(37)-N1)-methyltransferase TrmD [Nitrospirales bacterium]|nr:tRNA (guanosine(37)-N1)-methyltransferase TrmD [Nitrospira sp.]MDR4501677.1 tRNA (guanosine(37)-N1)-methyltransferase TrmD [Nitrospirales bacterium]
MQCDVLTLFPDSIRAVTSESIVKRAQDKGLLTLTIHNIRDYADGPHYNADDTPYGGGEGMVMKAEPIFRVIDAIQCTSQHLRVILPSPQGIPFTQRHAERFSRESQRVVFICGHYEGIDERVRTKLSAEEISIGDYVLTGGELAAMVMIDASVRLIPGVLGDPDSAIHDSFTESLLDYPHYTRPHEIRGLAIPEVLSSGNHEAVRRWRRKEALRNTLVKRPDLLNQQSFIEEDQRLLDEIVAEKPSITDTYTS